MEHATHQNSRVLRDLIEDHLELKCKLPEAARQFLLGEFEKENLTVDEIIPLEAFSVEGRVLIVAGKTAASHCWVYFREDGKLEKRLLANTASAVFELAQAVV